MITQTNSKKVIGCDLSHHNMDEVLIGGLAFYLLKATEGKTYSDKALTSLMVRTWDISTGMINPIYGFYHYARPDLNSDYKSEADHYLDVISSHVGQCLLALDWEDKSLNQPSEWAYRWLEYVYSKTGVKPFFYASASAINTISNTDYGRKIFTKYPIWVAHYGKEADHRIYKKRGNIWQFTNTPCDLDIFYGSYLELAMKALPDSVKNGTS